MKMPGVVSELRSGHEKLMDGRIDRRTDGGHDIIRRVFDGRIKKEIKKKTKKQTKKKHSRHLPYYLFPRFSCSTIKLCLHKCADEMTIVQTLIRPVPTEQSDHGFLCLY